MLSETMIYEAVHDAMEVYADATGKKGLTKADLRKAILERGGDGVDLHNAMIAGLLLLTPEEPEYLS